jgi:ABC-2 type transport system permease protein
MTTQSSDSATEFRPRPLLAAGTLCWRELVRFFRQRNRVVGALGQPIVFWLLFGAGLGSSFRLPGSEEGGVSYREYFFPGTLVMILLFTAIFSTISIIEDRREGFLQSVLVAPIPRWSMVLGKVLGGTIIAMIQGLLFLALARTLGIHLEVLQFAKVVGMMFIIAIALTGLGFTIAWKMESTQGFHAIMSVFLLPMWLVSGAFFPVPSQPNGAIEWGLRWAMQANPLTYGVAGLRRLMYTETAEAPLPPETPSMAICLIVTLAFAALMFASSTAIARARTKGDLL